MKTTEYLGMNVAEAEDFADIRKVASNFPLLDAELKKNNSNTAAIKEALQILSSNVLIVDDATGVVYKIGSKSGKLYFTPVQENSIKQLAESIDTDASTVDDDSSIKTMSLVSMSSIGDAQIGEAEIIEEEEE